MDSTPGLDRYLAPISDDAPCGEDLRYEGTYDAIRDARRLDNPDLPRGVWEIDLKRADWAAVDRLCGEALTTKSKDINVAVWLAESWAHRRQFDGLAQGLTLIVELCEAFWDDLYPGIDDDGDLDGRLSPFAWMARNFLPLARLIPMTDPAGADVPPMTLDQWDGILRVENLAQKNQAAASRETAGQPDRTAFEASVSLTLSDRLLSTRNAIADCVTAVDRLDVILGDKCGYAAPSIQPLRELLERIGEMLDRALGERGVSDLAENPSASDSSPDAEEEHTMTDKDTDGAAVSGPITSRAEAYKRLSDVADYLMRTEPHSPVPYMIRRSILLGNMSFTDLMGELVKDGGDLGSALKVLGLDQMDKKQ